jgi:two-component system, OmpR family, manganese sensing sensor histidine kinase
MAWGIVSNPSHNPKFQVLKCHLFLSYLTVMLTILLVSAVVVFAFFRRSLHEQLDQRLTILAQAAPHDLLAIKEYNSKSKHNIRSKLSSQSPPFYCLDKDVDLDIPWHNLRIPEQGIEWFSAHGKLLGKAGTLVPDFPPKPGSHTYQHGQIRTLTIAAYGSSYGKQYLKGYIRSSESTRSVEATLNHLRWGLGWGGFVVLGLTGLSGLWLTRRSLKPIRQSLE